MSIENLQVVPLADDDRQWAQNLVREHFASDLVVSRGVLHDTAKLPGLAATLDGRPVGILHYRLEGDECEIVTLIAARRQRGVGTALLSAARDLASQTRCRRLWLVTTNDNTAAQALYRKAGMSLLAVHRGALDNSRALKPEIPLTHDGIRITDELEFELLLLP